MTCVHYYMWLHNYTHNYYTCWSQKQQTRPIIVHRAHVILHSLYKGRKFTFTLGKETTTKEVITLTQPHTTLDCTYMYTIHTPPCVHVLGTVYVQELYFVLYNYWSEHWHTHFTHTYTHTYIGSVDPGNLEYSDLTQRLDYPMDQQIRLHRLRKNGERPIITYSDDNPPSLSTYTIKPQLHL